MQDLEYELSTRNATYTYASSCQIEEKPKYNIIHGTYHPVDHEVRTAVMEPLDALMHEIMDDELTRGRPIRLPRRTRETTKVAALQS